MEQSSRVESSRGSTLPQIRGHAKQAFSCLLRNWLTARREYLRISRSTLNPLNSTPVAENTNASSSSQGGVGERGPSPASEIIPVPDHCALCCVAVHVPVVLPARITAAKKRSTNAQTKGHAMQALFEPSILRRELILSCKHNAKLAGVESGRRIAVIRNIEATSGCRHNATDHNIMSLNPAVLSGGRQVLQSSPLKHRFDETNCGLISVRRCRGNTEEMKMPNFEPAGIEGSACKTGQLRWPSCIFGASGSDVVRNVARTVLVRR